MLASDRAAVAMGELQVQETEVWNAAQERCYQVESYKKPVFDSGGKPLYLICAYIDITARKQAEEGLQVSLRQLRRLAAGLKLLKDDNHRRIAKGPHDDFGQNLMALMLDVEMLRARAGKRASRLSKRVGQALDTIDATIRSNWGCRPRSNGWSSSSNCAPVSPARCTLPATARCRPTHWRTCKWPGRGLPRNRPSLDAAPQAHAF